MKEEESDYVPFLITKGKLHQEDARAFMCACVCARACVCACELWHAYLTADELSFEILCERRQYKPPIGWVFTVDLFLLYS